MMVPVTFCHQDGFHTRTPKGLNISSMRKRLECPILSYSGSIHRNNILTFQQRIYTDANLYDGEELLIITESANQLLTDLNNKALAENVTLPNEIELVLEIRTQDTDKICGYYFVEHSSRCLFWLEEFDAEGICDEIKVVVSMSHLRKSVLH
jgi:hypothetical protein